MSLIGRNIACHLSSAADMPVSRSQESSHFEESRQWNSKLVRVPPRPLKAFQCAHQKRSTLPSGFGLENKDPLASCPGYVGLLLPWVNSVHDGRRTGD